MGWDPKELTEAKNQALVSWIQANPDRARQYVENSGELANGDRSMVWGLVRGGSYADPHATTEWLAKTGFGTRGDYKSVAGSISRSEGADGLEKWFASLSETGVSENDRMGIVIEITKVKVE